nr:crinkler 24 [Plasmopara viticola]
MLKLYCAVVGEESVAFVDIDEQQLVGDLKERIKSIEGYGFPSSRLTLYLAKENGVADGAWVTTPHPDYVRLLFGDAGVEATCLTTGMIGTLLDPTWSIKDSFYVRDQNFSKKKVIHVHVQLPDDRSAAIDAPIERFPLLGREVARTEKNGGKLRFHLVFLKTLHA